jgi:type IV secretion system protein VirB10
MSSNDGKITPVDAKPVKPPKEKKLKQDRGENKTRDKERKKMDWVALLMIIGTLVVVFGGVAKIFSGGEEAPLYDTTNTEIDEAIIMKETHSSESVKKLQVAIVKANEAEELKRLQADKERLEQERLAKEKAQQAADKKNQGNKTDNNTSVPVDTPPPTTPTNLPPPNVTDTSSSSGSDVPTPRERKLASNVMPVITLPPNTNNQSQTPANQSLDNQSFAHGSASTRNRNKRDLMLIHGTNIPCALQTEIISTYAGLVTCAVVSDVYSANGSTLLIEKGSKVFGNQNIALEQGQARVFLKWADIQTPEGVSIQIDSLGTGGLGASGVSAWVDNHFKERFGGAILLSFLDDAFATLANRTTNSNISTDNTQDNASDMASKALENSINIPPTAYVQIGTRLNILVARDIDMSNVYQLQPIR